MVYLSIDQINNLSSDDLRKSIHAQHHQATTETSIRLSILKPLSTVITPSNGPPITIKQMLASFINVKPRKVKLTTEEKTLIVDTSQAYDKPTQIIVYYLKENTNEVNIMINNLDKACETIFGTPSVLAQALQPHVKKYRGKRTLMREWDSDDDDWNTGEKPPPSEFSMHLRDFLPALPAITPKTPKKVNFNIGSNDQQNNERKNDTPSPKQRQEKNKKRKVGSPTKPPTSTTLTTSPPKQTQLTPHFLRHLQPEMANKNTQLTASTSFSPHPQIANSAIVRAAPAQVVRQAWNSEFPPLREPSANEDVRAFLSEQRQMNARAERREETMMVALNTMAMVLTKVDETQSILVDLILGRQPSNNQQAQPLLTTTNPVTQDDPRNQPLPPGGMEMDEEETTSFLEKND
jgi:hypothetical protein